ncbi:hypothetical protein [Streptomyces sp. NPDC102282]|uniref:hypothetical protein n=1 Tax=Streptomyces sp. NPDC102282 TaxID=3366154 RepID=UPI003824332F
MYDPVGRVRNVIDWQPGEGLTAYQEDVLGLLAKERCVAARGPHGLGKTAWPRSASSGWRRPATLPASTGRS